MIFRYPPKAVRTAMAALDPRRDAGLIRTLQTALQRHPQGEPTVELHFRTESDMQAVRRAYERSVIEGAGGRADPNHTTDRGTGYTR